jgi:L-rhamnose 1-dehydrogenase
MLLKEKAVLVTGASAGIGRAAAIAAARHGADVAINFLGHADEAASCVAEIEALGCKAVAIAGDVADPGTAIDFVSRATEALGRVDVFVNNAGICPFHAFLDMPVATLERTMRVDFARCLFHGPGRSEPDGATGAGRGDRGGIVDLGACRR